MCFNAITGSAASYLSDFLHGLLLAPSVRPLAHVYSDFNNKTFIIFMIKKLKVNIIKHVMHSHL